MALSHGGGAQYILTAEDTVCVYKNLVLIFREFFQAPFARMI